MRSQWKKQEIFFFENNFFSFWFQNFHKNYLIISSFLPNAIISKKNYQKLLFFQFDIKIILFQWENKRKIKMLFNNQNVLFYFFTIFIHFSIKNISYSVYFFSFSSKNKFCVFSKKRRNKSEKLLRNILHFFPNSKMISKREKIQIKIFLISFWYNNTIYKKPKKIHHQKMFLFFSFFSLFYKNKP